MKIVKFFECNWVCVCGQTRPDDTNFCMYCDRERPLGS
jgi:hypothetical protein